VRQLVSQNPYSTNGDCFIATLYVTKKGTNMNYCIRQSHKTDPNLKQQYPGNAMPRNSLSSFGETAKKDTLKYAKRTQSGVNKRETR
jgi:hypothetical protein